MFLNQPIKTREVEFAGQLFCLHPQAALYWPKQNTLIIADMHLEKGSYFAQRGNPLPLYDTLDTLNRLEQLILYYNPTRVISVGDAIHDMHAFKRMNHQSYKQLFSLLQTVEQWVWIIGNHDGTLIPDLLPHVEISVQKTVGQISFSHDFIPDASWQIVGHYHPQARIKQIKSKCFLINHTKIILPSFGSYTGGLNFKSRQFKKISSSDPFKSYLLHKNNVWRID